MLFISGQFQDTCYSILPTLEGCALTKKLFRDACDYNWETPYILKKNREVTTNKTFKIVNPIPVAEKVRVLTKWNDVYAAGEKNAIEKGASVESKWREI